MALKPQGISKTGEPGSVGGISSTVRGSAVTSTATVPAIAVTNTDLEEAKWQLARLIKSTFLQNGFVDPRLLEWADRNYPQYDVVPPIAPLTSFTEAPNLPPLIAVYLVRTTNQASLTTLAAQDSITPVSGDIILLVAQTIARQNGPWVMRAGAWERPTWWPSNGTTQAYKDQGFLIQAGTAAGGSIYRITTTGTITIDTTNVALSIVPLRVGSTFVVGILPVANGGTGLSAGTSGGILGFTAAGTIASSALLALNQVMLGGGSGALPTTLAAAGSTGRVLSSRAGTTAPAWDTFISLLITSLADTTVTAALPVAVSVQEYNYLKQIVSRLIWADTNAFGPRDMDLYNYSLINGGQDALPSPAAGTQVTVNSQAGFAYTYRTVGSNVRGTLSLGSGDATTATTLDIAATDNNGNNLLAEQGTWWSSTRAARVKVTKNSDPTVFGIYTTTSKIQPDQLQFGITYVSGAGTFLNGDAVTILVIQNGTTGAAGASGAVVPSTHDLRLTTESGVPVSTTNRSAQSTLYLTPFRGSYTATYDSSVWTLHSTAEISLALSGLTSGKNYDVFEYWTGSAVALELSAAWSSDTARTDAIDVQDGVWVKSSDHSRRLVGTIRTTSTTTTEDSYSRRLVWNAMNRVTRSMYCTDTTDSWTYTLTTIREARASGTVGESRVEYVCGLIEDALSAQNFNVITNSVGGTVARGGIGLNVTNANSDQLAGGTAQTIGLCCFSFLESYPVLGFNFICRTESSVASGTTTWFGDVALPAFLQTGMTVKVMT